MVRATELSATGQALAGQGTRALVGARLIAAAAAATAVVRDSSDSGPVILRLSAAVGSADDAFPPGGIAFGAHVHVTITGAGATVQLYA